MKAKTARTFILLTAGLITAALLWSYTHEKNLRQQLTENLLAHTTDCSGLTVSPTHAELPAPVARYFQHVLQHGQARIHTVKIRQQGSLRTATDSDNWLAFTARQRVTPLNPGFVWNARITTPLATHVRVLDSYIDGIASGRVSLLGSIPLASEAGVAELNAGALHRYLAESPWYPTALLPESGVFWRPVDDHTAIATLTDHGITVSLEFRFNAHDEIIAVYTPGRFGRFNNSYEKKPWEGHFRDYQLYQGMLVPAYGEVGWYENDRPALVWKGHITAIEYSLCS